MSSSTVNAMGIDITARVHVAREPAAVAAYMTDPANDREWIGGLREVALLGEPPLDVGSRVRRVAYFLGRRVEYVNEILALDATQLDMRSVEAPFPMRITYRFEPAADGGTTVSNHVRGGGPRVLAALVRRNVQRDLQRLRDVLEAQAPRTSTSAG
jgi:hypothetical protein